MLYIEGKLISYRCTTYGPLNRQSDEPAHDINITEANALHYNGH